MIVGNQDEYSDYMRERKVMMMGKTMVIGDNLRVMVSDKRE